MVNRYLDLRYKRVARTMGAWSAERFSSGVVIFSWEAGRPAPEKALRASYLGVDLSRAWRFRDGFYGTSMEPDITIWAVARCNTNHSRCVVATDSSKFGVWRLERAHV